MKHVFVMSTMSYTPLAIVIRIFTGKRYAHASLILDQDFREGYAFSRKRLNNPFIGAFVKEVYETYIRKFRHAECHIGAIEVDDATHARMSADLEAMYRERDSWGYNYAGLFLKMFKVDIRKPGSYYCAEFVDAVLKRYGLLETGKESHRVLASDFPGHPELRTVYEGKLATFIKGNRLRSAP